MPSKKLPKKGFTLIELLVVITIIAILSVVGLAAYTGVVKNARDARRKADLGKIKIYLETYYNNHQKYPQAGTCNYGANCYVYSTSGEGWIPGLVAEGIVTRLPVDPINNLAQPWNTGNFSYSYGNVSSDGQGYDLTTQLENTNDPDRCAVKNWHFYFDPIESWCSGASAGNNFGGGYSDQIYEAGTRR